MGVLDYYGEMEARHQMLAEIRRPRDEQEALDQEQDAAARDFYLGIIWENSPDVDFETAYEWANLSTEELKWEARRVSAANGNQAWGEFVLGNDEIYGIDSYANLKSATTAAMLILSFVPIASTGVDIIDGLSALARGDALGVALSLMGPIGDIAGAVGRMRRLLPAGEAAASALRGLNTIDSIDGPVGDFIRGGQRAADSAPRNLGRTADKLDEVVENLRGRVRSASRSGPNTGQGMEGTLTWERFYQLWGVDRQRPYWTLNHK